MPFAVHSFKLRIAYRRDTAGPKRGSDSVTSHVTTCQAQGAATQRTAVMFVMGFVTAVSAGVVCCKSWWLSRKRVALQVGPVRVANICTRVWQVLCD